MATYTEQLNDLLKQRSEISRKIEDFVDNHNSELVKEICDTFNLDPIQNEVTVGVLFGQNPHGFYKDNSEWHRTQMVSNYGHNWVSSN